MAAITLLEFSLLQIWRNVIILTMSFLFLFTAFASLQQLQPSMFVEDGMGAIVLAVVYGFFFLSTLLFSAPLIAAVGKETHNGFITTQNIISK